MSTPVDLNIVMPYGVTVESDGSRNARIVTNSAQTSSNIALKLPDGPCRVAASWDGPEAVRLVHTGHGYPVTIPAGGGIAPGWPLSARRRAKRSTCRTPRLRHSRRAGAAPSRCTRSTPSSHPQGGGVGDHSRYRSESGSRREIVCCTGRWRRTCAFRLYQVARRGFNNHGGKSRNRSNGSSVGSAFVIGALSLTQSDEGRHGCSVERGGARGEDAVCVGRDRSRGGCGSDDHHLATSVAAGGGALNDRTRYRTVDAVRHRMGETRRGDQPRQNRQQQQCVDRTHTRVRVPNRVAKQHWREHLAVLEQRQLGYGPNNEDRRRRRSFGSRWRAQNVHRRCQARPEDGDSSFAAERVTGQYRRHSGRSSNPHANHQRVAQGVAA